MTYKNIISPGNIENIFWGHKFAQKTINQICKEPRIPKKTNELPHPLCLKCYSDFLFYFFPYKYGIPGIYIYIPGEP